MDAKTFEEDMYTSDSADPIVPGTDSQAVVDTSPVAAEAPLDTAPLPEETPVGEAPEQRPPLDTNAGSPETLLNPADSERFRSRWSQIQGRFVDEPRSAVQQADALVAEVIEQITQSFASEISSLESQWNQGDDVSTEDLRQALQHYRSFFNRLMV
jgi:hypothetical protein